jgi:hypothetical protein
MNKVSKHKGRWWWLLQLFSRSTNITPNNTHAMSNNQSSPSLFEHIPAEVKGQLLEIAERLPNKEAQKSFLNGVSARIGELAGTYENTIVYSAVGWAIGAIVDHILHIPFTHIALTPAGEISPLVGAILGFREDKKKQKERAEVLEIIAEELAKANRQKEV